jgi:hypothetical protein
MTAKRFFVAFLLVAVVLAGFVSYFASSAPDGLTRTADDHGISAAEKPHASADSPLADYGILGVDNDLLSGGLAGVVGVGVVLVLAGGLALAVRRRSRQA